MCTKCVYGGPAVTSDRQLVHARVTMWYTKIKNIVTASLPDRTSSLLQTVTYLQNAYELAGGQE